jgi:fructose-bisphosphate aldolase class II
MLVTMKEILNRASVENYAVAAPNIQSELNARAYIEAAEELNAPIIIDIGHHAHPDIFFLGRIVRQLAIQSCVPVAINLDHGPEKWKIMAGIQAGFTSVMVDRSALSFEENVTQVKEIVDIAHGLNITVEAELGHVGSAQNYSEDRDAALTSVEEAVKYIELTNVDCLAVAIGTAHGAYPKGFKPYLDFDRLAEIKKATNNFPLVLHGSSGTAIEDLCKACAMGINKVNIAYDLCKAATDAVMAADLEGQKAYHIWNTVREGAKNKLKEMINVYGSENKAWVPVCKGLGTKQTSMEE